MLVKSQVKYIQSLGQKKFRDQEGVFVAEGPKIVAELLGASNTPLIGLYAVKEWIDDNRSILAVLPPGRITEIRESELGRISSLATPNQVLALFGHPVFVAATPPQQSATPDPQIAIPESQDAIPDPPNPTPKWQDAGSVPKDSPQNGIWLMLDNIQDPGNLGTIVRIADWFGLRRVICSTDSADVFNTKAVQSTMGSIARVKVDYADPEDFIFRHPGLPVYATALGGISIYRMEPLSAGILVIGNESKGIRESLLQKIAYHITIPRIGGAESLNAAVATGIVLSHLVGG